MRRSVLTMVSKPGWVVLLEGVLFPTNVAPKEIPLKGRKLVTA